MSRPDPSTPAARHLPRRDVGFAALCVAATLAAATLHSMVASDRPWLDPVGVVLIVVVAGATGLRRWPLLALAIGVVAAVPYHVLAHPPEVVLPALLVLLYAVSVANPGRLVVAVGLSVTLTLVVAMRFSDGGWPGDAAVAPIGWLVGVLGFGQAIRSERAYNVAMQQRAERAEQAREQEARRRVAEERLRIARDLHDVMAHSIAVIRMQSSVAAHLLDERSDDGVGVIAELSPSLHNIAEAAGVALADLRSTLQVLRGAEDADREVVPGLERLEQLLGSARAADVEVKVDLLGETRALPPAVDIAAYRIIQEALTNVGRHARRPAAAMVTLEYRQRSLCVRITDDGDEVPGADIDPGYGMIGMAERAHIVGGTFAAGPMSGGGFVVEAVLPTSEPTSEPTSIAAPNGESSS